MATLNQHLSFQGMERNDATHQYYDHARSQQFNIGRFLSTDPYHGSIEDPQLGTDIASRWVTPFDTQILTASTPMMSRTMTCPRALAWQTLRLVVRRLQ